MKRNLLSLLYLLLFINPSYSQAPEIEWQNRTGGTSTDQIYSVSQTLENECILGGRSSSNISDEKTESCLGSFDYWVLKLNSIGDIVWDNTIGGNNSDDLKCIVTAPDGGFLLCGSSLSGISGDKTESNIGNYDYWILKINDLGIIQWQNTIGGTNVDMLMSAISTIDGGYLIGGYSSSSISGDKTEAGRGGSDYWLIKITSLGAIEWQKTIGGNGEDILKSVIQTEDGGFLIGGQSSSGISGEKSEASLGLYDCWVLKLSSIGNIEWQNSIGGNDNDFLTSVAQNSEGDYYIGASSSSIISGDKIQSSLFSDYWALKLSITGSLISQKTFLANDFDIMTSLIVTNENNLLIGGYSNSNASGSKIDNSLGMNDFWVFETDNSFNILWQKTIGGNYDDILNSMAELEEGSYLLGGNTISSVSLELYDAGYGSEDYLAIKLTPDCTPSPELCNSLDDNCNGLIDDAITETISISAGGPITFCQGGNVLLTATYSGATVQWKKNGVNIPGATSPTYLVTTKATYTCVTTSACGTATSTGIFVNVNKNPTASITAGGATTFCAGGSVILTANAGGGLSYQWYKGASLIAGATSINYTATIAGNYKCRVTKTVTGCFKNSNVISVSVPCKEGENVDVENALNIYPNPNDGTFTIEANVMTQDFASPESTIEIYNNLGQLIFSKEINSNDGKINENIEIKNIIPGIYLVKLWNNNIQNVKNIIIE